MTRARGLLVLGLWAGFWLMAIALVFALLLVGYLQSVYGDGLGPAGVVSGLLALALGWALRPRGWLARNKRGDEVPPLSEREHPALYAFVADVARRAGARPPKGVHLSIGATAFAYQERRWLGLRRTDQVGIGLPLLAYLSRTELTAVLAHEFGHHSAGDTTLSGWVYRTRRSIGSALEQLDDSAFFLDLPFRAYANLFLRVSAASSRQQELAADALSAAAVGVGPAASALARVHALAAPWGAYVDHEVLPAISGGHRVPILEGFRRFLSVPRHREEVARAIRAEEAAAPTDWDTHPTLAERIQALGTVAPRVSLRDSHSSLELLGGEEAAESAWYALAVREGTTKVSWEEMGARVLATALKSAFESSSLDPAREPIESLHRLAQDPETTWRRASGGLDVLSPAAKRKRAELLLVDWLTAALIRRGYQVQTDPGAPVMLQREAQRLDPREIVTRVSSGAMSEAQYLAWCAELEPIIEAQPVTR